MFFFSLFRAAGWSRLNRNNRFVLNIKLVCDLADRNKHRAAYGCRLCKYKQSG